VKQLRRVFLALLVGLSAIPPLGLPRKASADYSIGNGYFYTQTGGGGGRGFSIVDDGAALLWSEFNRLGGVDAVGYPTSTRFLWDGFIVQATQRVVLQWRPEARQAYAVNVFDLLHQAGKDDWLLAVRATPRPLGPEFDAGLTWEQIVAKRLSLLGQNIAIRNAYYGVVGDPLLMNGLPTSPVTDMGNHYALRAQRVVFQHWKEDVPWALAGQVTVALGGSIAAEAGLLPPGAIEAEAAPGAVPSIVTAPGSEAGPQFPAMPAGGFGYGFQVDQGADYDRALRLTSEAGFKWVKVQVRWKDLEPAPGAVTWGFFDPVIAKAQARNLKVLFSVTTAPDWARPAGADLSMNGPPASPEPLARLVGSIASRYKGRVAAFEIWNEQNLSRDWGGAGRQSAPEYVALLQEAYRAIKAADPAALVITGALTPAGNVDLGSGLLAVDDLDYFRQMYQAGMKGFFDGVGVHPSGFNNPPEMDPRDPTVLGRPGRFKDHRSFYFRTFEGYREIMAEHGDESKGLWFTEFGWATGPADEEWAYALDNSEADQARYLVEAFKIARERGYVVAMFVWNLNHWDPSEAGHGFSVLRPDWSPRPAYTALSRMAK